LIFFEMKKEIIYLDHNSTTPCLPEVLEILRIYSLEKFADPDSPYIFGKEIKDHLENFRKIIADLISAEPEEIIFTSGGREANNLALFGIAFNKKKGRILISAFEHPSILKSAQKLSKLGFEIDFIPVNSQGYVEPEEVKRRIKPDTILISVTLANHEIGTIQPIKDIADICREKGILLHTDACQAVGKIHIDVKDLGCDLLSFTGHKMYAPKGIGALYIRKGINLSSLFLDNQKDLENGTKPVELIAGFAKACEIVKNDLPYESQRLIYLREKLYEGFKNIYSKIYRFGISEKTLPNTLTISFEGLDSIKILKDLPQICASPCSVSISAMKIGVEKIKGAIRFSLGRLNNLNDIEKTLEIFSEYFKKCLKI